MDSLEYLYKMDRTAVSVVDLHDNTDLEDTDFWLSKPPEHRWIALELLRQRFYGIEATSARLERVLEVVERS